jgi:hypothetical protein
MRGCRRRFRWWRRNLYLSYTTQKVGDESTIEWAIEQVAADACVGADLLDVIRVKLEKKPAGVSGGHKRKVGRRRTRSCMVL